MNIIASAPISSHSDDVRLGFVHVVVDRGDGHAHRFVSASASAHSLANGEWFWGHYFVTSEEAMAHFNSRERRG